MTRGLPEKPLRVGRRPRIALALSSGLVLAACTATLWSRQASNDPPAIIGNSATSLFASPVARAIASRHWVGACVATQTRRRPRSGAATAVRVSIGAWSAGATA